MTVANEGTSLPGYQNKTLADFYTTLGAILCDCYLASNLVGGTPGGRPEDLEVHPITKEVFISYTDNRPSSDGYPDSRIFVVAKYKADVNTAQHFGGLYKIVEASADGSGTTFTWQIFKQGGEDGTRGGAGIVNQGGAPPGAGFALSDNLAFDKNGNLLGVIDMSTDKHNGFSLGAAPTQNTIDHTVVGNAENLLGCFGNNWMYVIPASGPDAGKVIPFGIGPMRCEMTGPTFVGETLLLSVQHPSEDSPIGNTVLLNRTIQILALDGTTFDQDRTVPRGSNWPSNLLGSLAGPPIPSVVGIQRKGGGAFF
jgi:secreted PhoX family phosphatase